MHPEHLPTAEAMGDSDSIALIKFSCARIRFQRDGWEKGKAQAIFDELAESFAIVREIGRTDFIASIGELYGQVLAASRNPDPGLEVREETAAAFEKLKRSKDAPRVRAVQEQIRAARAKTV
jgi:hypothetical protein